MAKKENYRYQEESPSRLYVDGTVVRREEPSQSNLGESREAVSHRVRKNREKALHMTLPYVVMLAAATVATVAICYQYLKVQSSIVAKKHSINNLQTTIAELKTKNNAEEDGIEIYTDLDYIYKVATEELGMVYPSEDQVIRYDKTESEYVRQYEDIPTED